MDAKAFAARTASLLSLTCGICAVSAAQAPAAKHGFTPADWYKVATVSTPALSPDGGKVAFTVTTVRESENRRHTEVWVAPTSGGDAARYTSPGFESSAPRFSDDGKILYFTSQRPGADAARQWALRMDQPSGEAYQPDRRTAVPAGLSAGGPELHDHYGNGGVARDVVVAAADAAAQPADSTVRLGDRERSVRTHAADLAPALQRDHEAGKSGALRRPADRRHDRTSRTDSREFIAGPRTAPRPDTPRPRRSSSSVRRAAREADHEHQLLAPRRRVSPDGKWIVFVADAKLRSDSVVTVETRFGRQAAARSQARRSGAQRHRDLHPSRRRVRGSRRAECTPHKIEYAGNETQIVVVAGQQAHRVRRPAGPLQESASVRRRRRRRQAAGHSRHLEVRAGQDRVVQGRQDPHGDVDRRQHAASTDRSRPRRRSRRFSADVAR